ncbi:MAG: hypothetical protein J6Z49_04325 [Kiritimatiellae bacterium]|nr:hypothetical protein [Kiritimatiellia bacterium]
MCRKSVRRSSGFCLSLSIVLSFLSLVAAGANLNWPNLEEVIIVSKCHLDAGYTMPVPQLQEKIRKNDCEKALALFGQDRNQPEDGRFRWVFPVWSMETALDEHQDAARRARIEEAVREGRFVWHAMPFTIETESSDLEELVRIVGRSSAMSRRFGKPLSLWAKQTDVPDQAWALPTVLAHSNVKFLHMGINGCSKPARETNKMPMLCWWEGPDGSRILLGTSPQYGWKNITPPQGWKYRKWLAIIVGGDNAGLPSRKDIDRIFEKAKKSLPGVRIRFGDPAEFADAIIAEEKANPSLPVVRGDMPDTWIHGVMSLPESTAVHRRATGDLVTLGQLDTTLRAFGIATAPVAELLDRAWRDSGLYSEHTWGLQGHRIRGAKLYDGNFRRRYDAGEYKAFDESFQYHADYAHRARKAAQDGIKVRMAALARNVAAEGPRVVVFNPLPYERDAEVEVEMPEDYSLLGGVRDSGKVKFLAKGLPAGGYKTFAVSRVEHRENRNDLPVLHGQRNQFRHFTVKFDLEKGGIASLVENATGRELVKQGGHALGQFLHERFSRNEVNRYSKIYNERQQNDGLCKPGMPDAAHSPYAAITPSGWRAKMKRSPLGVEVVLTPDDTKGLAKAYELRFSFPDHLPCVDIAWRVEDKTPDPIPEGGWLCLPFNVEGPTFRVGRIGGTIDPTKDIIFGASKDILCADRAITVRNGFGGAGVGVASTDLPLWSLGRPGLWRYEPDYVPTEPEVFANLYNNQWNTNYPLWIPGSWAVSLRVYPVSEGTGEEAAVFTPAWEIRQPAVAAFADIENNSLAGQVERVENRHDRHGQGDNGREGSTLPAAGATGRVPPVQTGVELSRKGVRVTAFCPNPDGEGIVLRVWEQAGKSGDITVTLPKGMKAVRALPVNLRGESTGEQLAVEDGRFTFALGAWMPKSFVLTEGRETTVEERKTQRNLPLARLAGIW